MVSRKGSQAPSPPLSVKGIGNKGGFFSPRFCCDCSVDLTLWCFSLTCGGPTVAKPDYSESKIVVAMVSSPR